MDDPRLVQGSGWNIRICPRWFSSLPFTIECGFPSLAALGICGGWNPSHFPPHLPILKSVCRGSPLLSRSWKLPSAKLPRLHRPQQKLTIPKSIQPFAHDNLSSRLDASFSTPTGSPFSPAHVQMIRPRARRPHLSTRAPTPVTSRLAC